MVSTTTGLSPKGELGGLVFRKSGSSAGGKMGEFDWGDITVGREVRRAGASEKTGEGTEEPLPGGI